MTNQRVKKKGEGITSVFRNGGCSASYDSFVQGSNSVLRLSFCAKKPPLRKAEKRCSQVEKRKMNHQEMNLNIRCDLPNETFENGIPEIYKKMEGWIGFANEEVKWRKNLPHWFSFDENGKHMYASVEPGGLQFTGLVENDEWENWETIIKQIATNQLGFKVGGIEVGDV